MPVPSLFLVSAVGTISAYRHTWTDVRIAIALSASAALFGLIIGQLGRLLPQTHRGPTTPTQRTPLRQLLTSAAARADAGAYLLGPLLAGSAATIIGIDHPYWAAVSATVPLSGTALAAQISRASLRKVWSHVAAQCRHQLEPR